MTFKERMSEIMQSIRAAAVSSPAVFFFISAAGISQLFYKYIPNAIHLNVLFSFSVVLLCNDRIKAATARTKLMIFCGQIGLYIVNMLVLHLRFYLLFPCKRLSYRI